MTKTTIKHRVTAFFFLIIFSLETFYPAVSYGLTSGPTTPEMSAFEPASTANMVDMFSGDFSYNIPLLDVGGYPVNLAYHSGAGPEEEASWVGFGWSLNPGAINRQLRGLPDDFSGEMIKQEDNKKPTISVSANINVPLKLFAIRLPKIKKKKGKGKFKLGISHNNYTGFSGMVGIGTAFNASQQSSDGFTKGLGMSGNVGINVSNQSGINPYAAYELNYKITTKKEREAQKNLREAQADHLGNMMVNAAFDDEVMDEKASEAKVADMQKILNKNESSPMGMGSSAIDFNGFQPPASVQIPMESFNFSASLEIGVHVAGVTVTPGIEGSYSKQKLKNNYNEAPGYGFMNSHLASTNDDAVLDYNMEKEAPYIKRMPNLGVTVFTPDLFSVTSNAGSMQFRPYLKGTGVFFQPHKYERDISPTIGLQPAFGYVFHIGIPLQLNKTNSISGKWNSNNKYIDHGNFKHNDNGNPGNQAFYFKRVGEKNKQDVNYFNAIGKTAAVAVKLDKTPASWLIGKGTADRYLRVKDGGDIDAAAGQARTVRDKANNAITYLTAAEASKYGLDKQIPNYAAGVLPTTANANVPLARVTTTRNANHISQYSITQDDGQRMIYGTPVYNTEQEEVSFAISENATVVNGIVKYGGADNTINNGNGKDNYFHKSRMPAYTTGHLLTGILSPDYVDIKADGITDDDLGTAVKFNYTQITSATNLYTWRTPYTNYNGANDNNSTANYTRGYNSIKTDDKANYSWGKKELWNLHSIESKTMVAQFYTEDRDDARGVVGENGGKAGSMLKRVKEIKLFSKADLYANGTNAVPIKVVHFEYYPDYPLLFALPNNATGKGKLTLKRVWFTYGNNDKGQYNSYYFKYKIPTNNVYADNQSDRWGTYKPSSINPSGLDNIDFPYSTQDKTLADDNVSNWQLNEVELPSGGIINVQYESDDYSYVQNRRAAQMCVITGLGANGAATGFGKSDKFYVKLPSACTTTELRQRYFENMKSLAYKSWVDLDGQGHYEWVSGYAEIISYKIADGTTDVVEITVSKINKYNPLAKAAWQKLKLDLPIYAYPEYDNIDSENSGFISAIRALGATFGRFKDLIESFDKRAIRKGFGDRIDLSKSWARLCTPIGINGIAKGKLGGGHRVKEIRINDKWATMSGVANAETGMYGQTYEYTTEYAGPSGQAETISSGVASYEPTTGGDENPFREPINYTDKHLFSKPKYFFLEKPMGESFFPGASVGYSKITVKNIGADGSVGSTGTSVSEFYTAKDFPTKVDELPMQRNTPKLSLLPRLFGAKITSAVTVSQGYVIENNDMHGKQKGEAVYAKNGDKISSAKYFYKVDNPSAETQDLNNEVSVISRNGVIEPNATVGMDIDMFTEMNESIMENLGVAIDPAFQINSIFPPIIKVKLPLPKPNYEKRMYRGSTTTKLVNRYAILQKVVKTVNGSTNTSENMLWDAETGEILLSKTNNEFEESTYSFSYPAHWAYDGMGSAFKNEGLYLKGLAIAGNGQITNFTSSLMPGDEIIDLAGNKKYWVSKPSYNGSPALYLIDKDGIAPPTALNFDAKILRSGRRNLAAASVGTVISMVNPITAGGTSLNFDVNNKILQAKAVSYEEYWPMPVPVICQQQSSSVCWSLNNNSNTLVPTQTLTTPFVPFSTYSASTDGTYIYSSGYNSSGEGNKILMTTNYWKNNHLNGNNCIDGPLNRCGVWVNTNLPPFLRTTNAYSKDSIISNRVVDNCNYTIGTVKRWLGYTFNYTLNQTRTLYVGIAADNRYQIKINGSSVVLRNVDEEYNFNYWNIYPICLDAGSYTFEFLAYNRQDNPLYPQFEYGGFGAEIYDNTLSQLQSAISDNNLNIIFSTRNIIGQNVETGNNGLGYLAPSGYFIRKNGINQYEAKQINSLPPTLSGNATNITIFNPYFTGILGNWRAKTEYLYDTKRVNNVLNPAVESGTNLRNAGYFESYVGFWQNNGNTWLPNGATASPTNWRWTSQTVKYNRKGQEVENMDALNRYSSSQYGYLESVPTAVASNARYREIGYDGFEDYNFNLGNMLAPWDSCAIQDHFSFRNFMGAAATPDANASHTGKYSLKLNGTVAISKPIMLTEPYLIYAIAGTNNNQYQITDGYLRWGFLPMPSKKYILSGWVKDGQPRVATINGFTLKVSGTTYDVNANNTVASKVHTIEGWKRFEVVFDMPATGKFNLELVGANVNLDDIRIHPYDAQLKSYAYDASSMRLMADLDENNFATFYEYDDEGTLVRVKKETEKGISTIKETRSSIRKRIP
jgi:hypothetical protein